MTFQEIVQKIKDLGFTNEEIKNGERYLNEAGEDGNHWLDVHKAIENVTGKMEDVTTDKTFDGADITQVYKFVDHDVYLGFNWSYSSWGDSDFDEGFFEVRPQEESVIRYVEVKK